MRIAHIAFNFGFWCECCHRIHHDDIHCTGPNQHIHDFQRLISGVWLGDEKLIDIDTQLACIDRIQSVLGINKCCCTTGFLTLGDCLERHGRLARSLRAVNFDNAPARQTTYTKR